MNINPSFLQSSMYNNLGNSNYLEMVMEEHAHHHLHDHTINPSLHPFSWPSGDFPFQRHDSPSPAPLSGHFLSNPSTLYVDHRKNEETLPNESIREDGEEEELGEMKEMMYKIAAMQPVDIDPATIRKPKRRNVRISDDPQSVAARHRRERISEKIRILQRLVPGGTKMDTASMLDEAVRYVKFLKRQIRQLQSDNQSQTQGQDGQTWQAAVHPPPPDGHEPRGFAGGGLGTFGFNQEVTSD